MTSDKCDINFAELERELQGAIDADARYWKENDAKFRAVNQKVQTYDEFRDIVKAAHLRPLEKKDHLNVLAKGCIWNSSANKNNKHKAENESSNVYIETSVNVLECPTSGIQFLQHWKRFDKSQHFEFLKIVSKGPTEVISGIEIPAEIFMEIIDALSSSINSDDLKTGIIILKSLSKSKRFTLMKDFLKYEEKKKCQELFNNLFKLLENDMGNNNDLIPSKNELIELQKNVL